MAKSLAAHGVRTVILDLNKEAAVDVAKAIEKEFDTPYIGLSASVLDKFLLRLQKKISTINSDQLTSCEWSR